MFVSFHPDTHKIFITDKLLAIQEPKCPLVAQYRAINSYFVPGYLLIDIIDLLTTLSVTRPPKSSSSSSFTTLEITQSGIETG